MANMIEDVTIEAIAKGLIANAANIEYHYGKRISKKGVSIPNKLKPCQAKLAEAIDDMQAVGRAQFAAGNKLLAFYAQMKDLEEAIIEQDEIEGLKELMEKHNLSISDIYALVESTYEYGRAV